MHEETGPEAARGNRIHWLENVFWYHYKWYYMVGVFAAVLIITSVIAFVTRVEWDWTVQYVHAGKADPAGIAALKKSFSAAATDESGNGRVQVQVAEYPGTGDPGRRDILGLLRNADNVIYVLDGETLKTWQALGYFGDAVPLEGGRWAATHDAPLTLFTLEEYASYGYSQEQIDESNEWMAGEHRRLLDAAGEILQRVISNK